MGARGIEWVHHSTSAERERCAVGVGAEVIKWVHHSTSAEPEYRSVGVEAGVGAGVGALSAQLYVAKERNKGPEFKRCGIFFKENLKGPVLDINEKKRKRLIDWENEEKSEPPRPPPPHLDKDFNGGSLLFRFETRSDASCWG